jgi:hypothetical protein
MGKVPDARELERREAVAVGYRPDALEPLAARLHPALGSEAAVVMRVEAPAGEDVVVEEAAVIDHPCDHLDAVADRRVEGELARPRLERIQDQHGPVDQLAVALEAADQVEREAVGRARRDADLPRKPVVPELAQRVPHLR